MVENEVDEVNLFIFFQLIPNNWRILLLLLPLPQIFVEVVDSELHRLGDHGLEIRFFRSKQNESWIGCWILRFEFLNQVEFPSISHNQTVLFELLQFTFLCFGQFPGLLSRQCVIFHLLRHLIPQYYINIDKVWEKKLNKKGATAMTSPLSSGAYTFSR